MQREVHAPVVVLGVVLAACSSSSGGSLAVEAGGPADVTSQDALASVDVSSQDAPASVDVSGGDADHGTPQGCEAGGSCVDAAPSGDGAPMDAAPCMTGEGGGPFGPVSCTAPVDTNNAYVPGTWDEVLARECPSYASTLSRCTGGLNSFYKWGIDSQWLGYYSAVTGNLVAIFSYGNGGPMCQGPTPPPCVSCVGDDSLCPGLPDGGGADSGNTLDGGTIDAPSAGD